MSNLHNIYPKVAIVADQMTAFGGADREMISMLKVFPRQTYSQYFSTRKMQ